MCPAAHQNPLVVQSVKGQGMPSSRTREKMLWYCSAGMHLLWEEQWEEPWCCQAGMSSQCSDTIPSAAGASAFSVCQPSAQVLPLLRDISACMGRLSNATGSCCLQRKGGVHH